MNLARWLLLTLPLALSGCTRASALGSSPAEEASTRAAKPAPSVVFDNERYDLAWVETRGDGTINEYLRAGETAESFKQMVTVSESRGTFGLQEFMKTYVSERKSMMARAPEVLARGDNEMMMISILVAADRSHAEFTIFRAVVVPNLGIKCYGFSKWLPYQQKVDANEVEDRKSKWIDQIVAMDLPVVRQKPQ